MISKSSYDLKLARAEKHLIDLEAEIARYVDSHPYSVTPTMEGKRKVYRFAFADQPADNIALMVGDFLYNTHTALDYLACSLVPSANRSRVAFPIFWQGVWNDAVSGDDKERLKDRDRWNSYTRAMPEGAVAILKANQPDDLGRDVVNTHPLAMLKRLRNTDAHRKLLLVGSTLLNPVLYIETEDGGIGIGRDESFGPRDGLKDDAPIAGVPDNAVNVKVTGSPTVMIRLGINDVGGYSLDSLRPLALENSRRMIDALRVYDRTT